MKSLALVLSYLTAPMRRRNVRLVLWLVLILLVLVAVYSAVFHVVMDREGQRHSWATALYWTIVTMSTLGFGDITFQSDAGRLFSVVVLVSGALFILVLLPFAFIQFIFMPWMSHRESNRAPRRLADDVAGHIVLTGPGAITDALIRRAEDSNVPYVLIEPDLQEALALHDRGYRVMVGELDDPETYRAARVGAAALVATTRTDTTNTNVAFTVREISASVPIVATANSEASVDILGLAGCNEVLRLGDVLGHAIARRVVGRDARHQVVGEFGSLLIAEAGAATTSLVGQTLRDAAVRERCNVNIVGMWRRGLYETAGPDTLITERAVLILAGSAEQLAHYDEAYGTGERSGNPVVIIGGGRVGRAAGRLLSQAGVRYRIVEQRVDRIRDDHYVHGDAAALEVLEDAGLREASAVLVTTHDDDMNVYLTLYCRRLEPGIQIISRANLDRNVSTLHRAGADAVLSYASLGASAIWNVMGLNDTLVVAEGLEVFRVPIPASIAGRSLADSALRQRTGCTVVALAAGNEISTNPDVSEPLPHDADLIIIGDSASEQRFLARFPAARSRVGSRRG